MIKKRITILIPIFICTLLFGQKEKDKLPTESEILKEISEKACKCIDSINGYNKIKDSINKEISSCIDKNVLVYSMSKNLAKTNADIESGKIKDKKVNITINSNPESDDYKKAYYEIESQLMKNCSRLKILVNAAESKKDVMTQNNDALKFYNKAIEASEKEDWKDAIKNYQLALEKDPKFIYAWDNMGLCYRRIGEYDNALNAYKKSLEIDPKGKMPLQNIAMAYIYKKEYQKAIDSYLALDKVHPGDAEVYYGIGQIYYEYLKDNEKSLNYMAKAYNIYTDQKSPYRTDAEKIISYIYKKMKDEGKTDRFKEILSNNKIRFE
ncbi:tetratricopeptide repeat protein [Chryseobacterium gwangjuense]|uniref:tetratricopeptide repeat protein n=1 Tax=Chryseobacterium gwangjuense TaxID=1069980 RepID=UPI001E3F48CB|nr:tetratricopeptide repeat protein [Chryseobacterium gwangjuense]MCE3076104.1 tetratricopeptide repeat protein [Chryseobacterium gwangjuense]